MSRNTRLTGRSQAGKSSDGGKAGVPVARLDTPRPVEAGKRSGRVTTRFSSPPGTPRVTTRGGERAGNARGRGRGGLRSGDGASSGRAQSEGRAPSEPSVGDEGSGTAVKAGGVLGDPVRTRVGGEKEAGSASSAERFGVEVPQGRVSGQVPIGGGVEVTSEGSPCR